MVKSRLWSNLFFLAIYSMIILPGLRAYVIPGNITDDYKLLMADYEDDRDINGDNSLSFLNEFVFGDTGEPLTMKLLLKERKLAKRSVTHNLVPQYMLDMYEYLSDKSYKVKFDEARSFKSAGKFCFRCNLFLCMKLILIRC